MSRFLEEQNLKDYEEFFIEAIKEYEEQRNSIVESRHQEIYNIRLSDVAVRSSSVVGKLNLESSEFDDLKEIEVALSENWNGKRITGQNLKVFQNGLSETRFRLLAEIFSETIEMEEFNVYRDRKEDELVAEYDLPLEY